MSTLLDTAIIVVVVIVVLTAIEVYLARRRETRILSETGSSIQGAREHSDAQIQETRKRTDAYQARIFTLMEEHNTLLREILSELKSRDKPS